MSCCIFSAVCCVMITSSMSGVALGYNYSLAEYIDTKETNVSVFMKRGVFDDDVHSEMDWRRRGQHPGGPGADDDEINLKTPAPAPVEPQVPLQSGRRMDDSILESDAHNKFEGSLMKLTAVPPYESSSEMPITGDVAMDNAISNFPHGSLEQLKAVQAVINMRKAAANRDTTAMGVEKSTYSIDDRNLAYLPNVANNPELSRRMGGIIGGQFPPLPETDLLKWKPGMENPVGIKAPGSTINPARFAIPAGIQDRYNWEAPKMKPQIYRRVFNTEDEPPPFMKPGTFYTGPIRPTTTTTPQNIPGVISSDQEIEAKPLKDLDKLEETLEVKKDVAEELEQKSTATPGDGVDYYEDENMKGLPVRRKRSIDNYRAKHTRVNLGGKAMNKDKPTVLTKLKVGKSISNEVADYPSILLNKLQLSKDDNFNKTVTNEEKRFKSNKGLSIGITSSTKAYLEGKVLSMIRSMFS